MNYKNILLIIFDGWGMAPKGPGNAIELAKKPFFDSLWRDYPHSELCASGKCVGLPEGEMGNSEVGHLTIGAGKPIETDIERINKDIQEGTFSGNKAITTLFEHVEKNNSVLHILGLVSPGGVHSHTSHLYAVLKAAKENGISKIAIHAITDGRDTPPQSAQEYLQDLEKVISELGVGFIASVSGRYYAMDRDNNWDRVTKASNALLEGVGENAQNTSSSKYVAGLYSKGEKDEFLQPLIFSNQNNQTFPIDRNDGVFFFNFRADRARELTKKISEEVQSKNLCFVTMTEYEPDPNCLVAYPPLKITQNLASEISKAGLSQSHIAETEKYAHVTYFLNGGNEKPYPKEERFLIKSNSSVATYDQAPEMRAHEIAEKAKAEIEKGINFVVLNFANADMVGHTAKIEPTIKAIEAVDSALKIVVDAANDCQYITFITADHGNAEELLDAKGQPKTAHTSNPVPAILTLKDAHLNDGGLSDVAPTILNLLGIKKPDEMTGLNLVQV